MRPFHQSKRSDNKRHNSYNSAMTVIAQDDHLTAGAWVACVLSGLNLIIEFLTLFAFVFILLC